MSAVHPLRRLDSQLQRVRRLSASPISTPTFDLADALESCQRFEIQIAGERISIPVRATYKIKHGRGDVANARNGSKADARRLMAGMG